MQDFRNLRVWHMAFQLAMAVYEVTKAFPVSERYGLTAQLRRAAVSVPANIAEGCGRRGRNDSARFYDIAMGSASELECEILLAQAFAYLEAHAGDELVGDTQAVKRMLAGLIRTIRKGPR